MKRFPDIHDQIIGKNTFVEWVQAFGSTEESLLIHLKQFISPLNRTKRYGYIKYNFLKESALFLLYLSFF